MHKFQNRMQYFICIRIYNQTHTLETKKNCQTINSISFKLKFCNLLKFSFFFLFIRKFIVANFTHKTNRWTQNIFFSVTDYYICIKLWIISKYLSRLFFLFFEIVRKNKVFPAEIVKEKKTKTKTHINTRPILCILYH